jgi:hypothetical protein
MVNAGPFPSRFKERSRSADSKIQQSASTSEGFPPASCSERLLPKSNYLAHSSGDAINAMLAAVVGYNFRRLIQWLRLLMLRILIAANFAIQLKSA